MNSLFVLLIVFIILILIVSGKTGLNNLLGLTFNFFTIFILLILISWGVNAILIVTLISPLILAFALFFSSDKLKITGTAFKASLIVVLLLIIIAIVVQHFGQFQGFNVEDNEELEQLSLSVNLSFSNIAIVVAVISMLGAVSEAALAVVTDLTEIIEQDEQMDLSILKEHRKLISEQILGTAINTLFFGMLGATVGLILWFVELNYSPSEIFNSKLLMADVSTMLLGMLGILLVIFLSGHYVIMDYINHQK